jgi:hypothetical protein
VLAEALWEVVWVAWGVEVFVSSSSSSSSSHATSSSLSAAASVINVSCHAAVANSCVKHTLENLLPLLLLLVDSLADKVVSHPESPVFDLFGHKLLHSPPEVLEFVQIRSNSLSLLVDVEPFLPLDPLLALWILRER